MMARELAWDRHDVIAGWVFRLTFTPLNPVAAEILDYMDQRSHHL
jgi:hypothetical protein